MKPIVPSPRISRRVLLSENFRISSSQKLSSEHFESRPWSCHSRCSFAFACQNLQSRARSLQLCVSAATRRICNRTLHYSLLLGWAKLCSKTWSVRRSVCRWVPDLISDASGGGLFTTGKGPSTSSTRSSKKSINRLRTPNISRSDMQNVLIAAYCRVVARKPG